MAAMQDLVPPITAPKLRRLYDYWAETCAGRPYPRRADLDPVAMGFILGNLILVDVLGAPGGERRFRIRLHGSNLAARHGYELTGKMLDTLPVGEQRDLARRSFGAVAASGAPLHAYRDCVLDGRQQRYETLILPLSSDGAGIDMLLVGLVHDDERPAAPAPAYKPGSGWPQRSR
jgi:hypothetical protein